MYSLSLSFIFFVTVMISTNLKVLEMAELREYGSELFCWTTASSEKMEKTFADNPLILDISWKPGPLQANNHQNSVYVNKGESHLQNTGLYFRIGVDLYPVTPNFESVADSRFVVEKESMEQYDTSYTGTERLFTAAGSQRSIVGSVIKDKLGVSSLDDTYMIGLSINGPQKTMFFKTKPMGFYALYPYYMLLDQNFFRQDILIPISAMPRLFDGIESIEDLWITGMLIKFKPDIHESEKDDLKTSLSPYCYEIFDIRTIQEDVLKASGMLDIVFSAQTYTALFLCLFSLVSSMYTNIIEQTKEIGIYRALGLSNFKINKIYIYESLILVISSSILGIMIGCFIAGTLVQQQILFSQFPIKFTIPSSVLLSVITGAIFTSIISVVLPLRELSKRSVAAVMRIFV